MLPLTLVIFGKNQCTLTSIKLARIRCMEIDIYHKKMMQKLSVDAPAEKRRTKDPIMKNYSKELHPIHGYLFLSNRNTLSFL